MPVNKIILWTILGVIIGSVVIMVVGLIHDNFFPRKIPTEIILTKSPLQVTFKGNNKVDVIQLVKDAKDFPFEDYKFNNKTEVKIENIDTSSNTANTKIDLQEKTDLQEKVNQEKN